MTGLLRLLVGGATLFAVCRVWAGEMPMPGPAPQPGEEKKEPETQERKKLVDMDLDELRAFQAFKYVPGGRDPFTFRKAKAEEKKQVDYNQDNRTEKTPSIFPPSTEEQARFLMEHRLRLEFLLLAHNYDDAIRVGETVRATVTTEWGGPPTNVDNNRLWRKILSYEKTARRLRQARETRREFEALQLEVKGIRWTPQGAAVLINEKVYEPGERVDGLRSKSPLQIEVIEEGAVVFIYKGQRFRKEIVAESE
jgi:hypothetical protein